MSDGRRSSADVETRIIVSTLTLIHEHGLTAVTMSAVAAAAGVARQTLYNHFPDVDSIVVAAITAHADDDSALLRATLGTFGSSAEKLAHLVRHTTLSAAEHGPALGSLAGVSPRVREAVVQQEGHRMDLVRGLLAEGRRTGEFRKSLSPHDAALVAAMLDRAGSLVTEQPRELEAITQAAIRTVLAAVRTPSMM